MAIPFEAVKVNNGLTYYKIVPFDEAGCKALFSTRKGGASEASFASLNLGLHVGDIRETVVENRKRLCQSAGWQLDAVVAAEQVHGDKVAVIEGGCRGQGAFDYESALPETDAMVTNERGIVLATFYADCVPIFFFDPEREVVASAHAGWKGTFNKIGIKTLAIMKNRYGTKPEHCLAAIGPSIGPCCYEVNYELANKFKSEHTWADKVLKLKGSAKWQLNLWEANSLQLLAAGIKEEKLFQARIRTSCNNHEFFSYRREKGLTGRMGAFISLK